MSSIDCKDIDYEEIPDSVKQAINDDERIVDSDKEDAARLLYAELQERNIDPDSKVAKSYIPVIVGILGVTLATMPRESKAFANDFINAIINQAIEPILSLLEVLQNGAMQMFGEFIKGSSESNATAQTAAADAQNTVRVRIAEQQIKAATAPTPQQCTSDSVAKQAMQSDAKRSANNEITLFGLTSSSMVGDRNLLAKDFKAQVQRHGTSGKNLNVHSVIKESGIETEEDHQAASDFLKNAVYIDTRSPTVESIDKSLEQGFETTAYRQMAEKAKTTNRRQIAMLPLVEAKSENDNRDGVSNRKALRAEIERTYGSNSEGWRQEIRGYADPTPLLAELNINTSLNNYLLLKQLEKQKQGAMVDSVSLLEQLET